MAETPARETGKTLALLDPETIRAIGAQVGGVVAIRGRRSTYARVSSAPRDAWGRGQIHVDTLTRSNAGTDLGRKVQVWPVAYRPAQVISVRPLGSGPLKEPTRDNYLGMLLDGLVLARGDRVRAYLVANQWQEYMVEDVGGDDPVLCTARTLVEIETAADNASAVASSYRDVGGLSRELRRVREMIELPLRHPELFDRLGITPPKGVLLLGPPGCGKTLIARAVAAESGAHFLHVGGPEIMHKFYGQSEANLRAKFEEARAMAPSILFLDEIDAIAPKREEARGEVEKRVVAQLLTMMDGLDDRGQVVVIGATNLPDVIDPALRRPGRFDREITIGMPDRQGREEILQIHTRSMPLEPDVDLGELAAATHGYVGADLAAVCREAAMHALHRTLPQIKDDREPVPEAVLGEIAVSMADMRGGLQAVEPSALREIGTETPDVTWADVGGLTEQKQLLEEAVVWPLRNPEWYEQVGATSIRGVLLAGPPGSGKTLLAQALANRCGVHFIAVSGPSLVSKWLGETEKAIRSIFQRARQVAPCIIFFDEIDSLFPSRTAGALSPGAGRAVGQFLAEMDGLPGLKQVVVVGATNRPDLIDPAALRPGRFDLVVPLPLPHAAARREILAIHTAGSLFAGAIDLDAWTGRTEGFSGAEVAALCRRAGQLAVAEALRAGGGGPPAGAVVPLATPEHFEQALSLVWRAPGSP